MLTSLLILALSAIPMSVGCSIVAVFLRVIMERMGIGGAAPAVTADIIVAVLTGAGVLAMTCAVYLPILANGMTPGELGHDVRPGWFRHWCTTSVMMCARHAAGCMYA